MTQRLVMLGITLLVASLAPAGYAVHDKRLRLALRAVAPRPPALLSLLEDH